MTQWKKHYNLLCDILSRSGVGFNSRGDYMIEAENDQWDQLGEAAKKMRYKPWPFYEDWIEIFGTDRATGDGAEDMIDAANELTTEDTVPTQAAFDNFEPFTDDLNEDEGQGDNTSQAAKQTNPGNLKGKRRKTGGELDRVCEVIGLIGNKADARLAELIKRIGFEFDIKSTKKEAFALLDFIPGLTLHQKFIVCQILAKELDKLDVFMGLPEEERPSYILFLLEESGKL